MAARFASPRSDRDLESGESFTPRFDERGLISCIVADARDGTVLMLAHMNEEALARTIEQRAAWFWSRSRNELWQKGATSGNRFEVVELLVDCDQDALLMKVKVAGQGQACHTGRRSCFYRRAPLGVKADAALKTIFIEPMRS
jgi:phosphoribosyl-AMP cyclohydrolase